MGAERRPTESRFAVLVGVVGLGLIVALLYAPLLPCLDTCMVDHVALRGSPLGNLELPDARLNTWILAWVQHSLLTDPTGLFDANIFYPARHALTQSEHLLTMAVLTLPLRLFTDNALLLHQLALMLSSLALGVTTAALVRWLGGSAFAAFLAGAASLLMPWRYTEPAHIQLMNAQWFPWIWLLIGRVIEGEHRRRTAIWLSLALTLQLLSSFYLSYYLALSCTLLALWLLARRGFDRHAFATLAAACVVPGTLLVAIAIPYLRWSTGSGFQALAVLFDSATIPEVLSVTAPTLSLGLVAPLPRPVTYEVSLGVAVLAGCGLALLWRRDARAGDATRDRRRDFAFGLALVSLAAFVMALGREFAVGDARIPLPSQWAAWVVPGFETLRNPLRWAIVIGLAFPVLAGIGLTELERRTGSGRVRMGLRMAAVALLALTLPLTPLPARDAWEGNSGRLAGWRALSELPRGPVIEIPWPLQGQRDIDLATQYMLGSTLHWHPITNGMSGYFPASYDLMRQVAGDLPSRGALARVRELADIRWLVVHRDLLAAAHQRQWAAAERLGTLRLAWSDDVTAIYEVPDWESGGRHLAALTSHEPRATTFAGLPRTPLKLAEDDGALSARLRGAFHFLGGRRLPRVVDVVLDNHSARPWPGFDVQTEGLVRLRYAFLDDAGEHWSGTSALASDVPPGRRLSLRVPVLPPIRAGRYRLRLDLVQRIGERNVPLPITPALLDVMVRPGVEPNEGEAEAASAR